MKIAFDTNFLIYAVQNKVDFFSQLLGSKFFVTSPVLRELKSMSKGKGKKGSSAKIALELLELKKVEVIDSRKSADESLLDLAEKGFVIATMDSELQKKIKEIGGKLAILRNKKKVELF